MRHIKLYEDYNDPLVGTRDLFSLRETITLKDMFGNKVVFQGPSESLDLATKITSKAKGPLSTIRAATWDRNRNQEMMDRVLITMRDELKEIGWEIIEWFGGLTPEEKAEMYGRGALLGSEHGIRLKEEYEDPLKGSEETRDLFGLTYKRELEIDDWYLEGPVENQEAADKIADWIENELIAVRDEFDDLENGESRALDEIDNRWEEIREDEELTNELAAIGYTLKEYEY
jgi:hypothetical protein